MSDLPTVLGPAGLIPTSPAALRQQLLAVVASTNPGYTILPAGLIEDVSSTDVGALSIIDQARVEVVNSLTPRGANAFVLNQLGQMLGVQIGTPTNTSARVVFAGTPGWAVADGFLVSDGTYQYAVQGGGIIKGDGFSAQLLVIATQTGIWSIDADAITQIVTTVPSGVTLTVSNPQPGLPGSDAETETSYRSRVLQANLAASQGMSRMLKTRLSEVEGVQARLISVLERDGGGWMILVGGGDSYEVSYAIFTSLFDISTLVGSEMIISGISSASPAVATTFLNHGYIAGTDVHVANSDPSDFNGDYAVLTVTDEKTFTLGTRFSARNATVASWSGGSVTLDFAAAHGVTVGSTITAIGFTPAGYNGTWVVDTVPSPTSLTYVTADPGSDTVLGSIAAGIALFDSTGLPPYVSGGILTPNERNDTASITDYPNTYVITHVNPPRQDVTMTVTWNTTSPNFVPPAAVAQVVVPALVDYVNSVYVGQPLNEFEMIRVFQDAVAGLIPASFLTRLVFSISINGVGTAPDAGTGVVEGDPQSYFFAQASGISVVQG